MGKKLKSLVHMAGHSIPAIALLLGVASISGACTHWFHQPKVPEQMKKFR